MRNLIIVFVSLLVLSFVFACSGEKEAEMRGRGEQEPAMESHEGHAVQGEMSVDRVVDPVCNMEINKADAVGSREYKGKTYYFCMEADEKAFEGNPEQYIAAK